MTNLKPYFLTLGIILVIYGYWLLAVPPDAQYEEMLTRAKGGVFSVVGGGGLLVAWLVK